jgi:hypothetical protein
VKQSVITISIPKAPGIDDREAYLALERMQRRKRRREVYGITQPHADLSAFDAYGMDVIEGRA